PAGCAAALVDSVRRSVESRSSGPGGPSSSPHEREADMIVRILLGFAAFAAADGAGAQAPESVEAALIALERQSWVAWQAQDSRFWQTFLSDDHVEMQGGGPMSKQAV